MKKANINLTAKQLAKKIDKGEFVFDNEIQRAVVWDNARKSMLINSLLLGYPVPPVFTKKGENGVYDVLDGKQRCTTLHSFINGGFPLSDMSIDWDGVNYDLTGLKFGELLEDMQEQILDTSLLVYYFEDISESEVIELFRRLNNGKSLTTKEINWAYCGDRENAKLLGLHPLFTRMFTPKALERKSHIPVIYKIYDMLLNSYDGADYSAVSMNGIMSNSTFSDDDLGDMWEVFDLLDGVLCRVHDMGKTPYDKARKELNLCSFVSVLLEQMKTTNTSDIDLQELANWYASFITIPPVEYTDASTNGTAKNGNIVARCETMIEHFNVCRELQENKKVEFDF